MAREEYFDFIGRSALAAALLLFSWAPSPSVAAEAEVQSLPVPVSIEGQRVRSSMYLRVALKSYDSVSLGAFSAAPLDDAERSYARLLSGLKEQNHAQVATSLAEATDAAGAERMASLYRQAFGNFEDTRSVCQVLLGDQRLFVWEWNSPQGLQRRAFVFEAGRGGPGGELVTSQRPLATLLVDALQNAAMDPVAYRPVANPDTRYQYRFPLAGDGNDAYLEFNGEPVDLDLWGSAKTPPNPALVAYRDALAALAAGDTDRFLASHTPASREKLESWIARMPPGELESWKATTLLDRRIRFVLDADPVFVIFYYYTVSLDERPGASAEGKRLTWSYVYHDPESDRYLISNAYREGFLDDLFKDERLFEREVLLFEERVLGGRR